MADKIKIAVCVPVYDKVESMFFQSFSSALSYFYETKLRNPETGEDIEKIVETFVVSGVVHQARNRLVYEAIKFGADYILWCDCDHVFPVDAFNRLLMHNKQIVGCNYARRVQSGPTSPTATRLDRHKYDENDRLLVTTRAKADAGELEQVDHMGMGLVLMHMSVINDIEEWSKANDEEMFPLFYWELTEEGSGQTKGEDAYFMEKCRKAGVDIWCDHGLSWEVGHLDRRILTNAHAEMQREQWLSREGV